MLFTSSNKNKAIDSIIRILEIPIALQLFSTLKHITPYIFVQALIYTKSTKDASVLLNISNRSIERGTKRLLGSRYLNYTSPLRNKLLNACNLQHCLQCDRIYPFTEEFFYKNKDCKISGLRHNCKDCSAQAFSNYYANNKNKIINNVRDRKELIKKATPSWADLFKINEIYNKCPIGFHVDHIVPLQGKNVSGLHIEYNLQYLLAKDNIEKSNKWEVS